MKIVAQVLAFDVISKILLGALSILFIRVMSFEEFTYFVFAISIATLLAQIFSSSFNRIYVIGFKHLNLERKLARYLFIQISMIIIVSAILLPFLKLPPEILITILLFSLAYTLLEASKTVYQQQQQFIKFSVIELTRAIVVCSLIFYLLWSLDGNLLAWHVLSVQALGMGIVFLIVISILLARKINIEHTKSDETLFNQIIYGPYRFLFGYFIVLSLFTQLDVLMLWFISDNIELATYGSAFRYYGLLSMVLGAVHIVLLPTIQNAKDGRELLEIFNSHKKIVWIFFPILFLSALFASYVLPWVDEGKYPDAVLVFRILCISALISLAFSPHVNWLMRAGKFKFLFALICVASIFNFILNSILIPLLGAIGAAIATALSSASVTVPIYIESRKTLDNLGAQKIKEFIF